MMGMLGRKIGGEMVFWRRVVIWEGREEMEDVVGCEWLANGLRG